MIWSWVFAGVMIVFAVAAFAGVMIVFAVAAFAWNARERRRLDAALRSCTDEQLAHLWLGPGLDGRQRGWIRAEMRRRGMEL